MDFNDCQVNIADLTGDGMVNIYDIIILVNCILDEGCNQVDTVNHSNQQ